MHPKKISIKDYSYFLPEEKIAIYPLPARDSAKLLIYKNGIIREDIYKNLDQYLPGNALLLFNNSKVIEARLLFQKPSGAFIEIFCLEPDERYIDFTLAFSEQGSVIWHCLIGGASKWKQGQILEKVIKLNHTVINLKARYIEKKADTFLIELFWTPDHLSFAEILHFIGAIPLPPYIKRNAEISDTERYQTLYAKQDGSVAAPTAGLHFTNELFEKLESKKIKQDFITLHIGAGTFKPVKSEKMEDHTMHTEWIDVSKETIENILINLDNPIITVGTTSLRTIESLYWMGVKLSIADTDEALTLTQWEAYDLIKKNIPAQASLQSLLTWMEVNKMNRLITRTQIIIAPGYKSHIANALITNFHMPQSTLLLLVAAVTGNVQATGEAGWRKIYDYALQQNFRFLSYGDGSLIWFSE